MSSIASLPTETLSTIFSLGVQDKQIEPDEQQFPFELLVSHVNTEWRDIALNYSREIWSHIHLTDNPHHPQLERIQEYIIRSGQFVLDIHISLSTGNSPLATTALDALFSQVYRWNRCTISIIVETTTHPSVARLANLNIAAPCLTHLSIDIVNFNMVPFPNNLWTRTGITPQILAGGSPRLSFLHLQGIALFYFRPPLTRITTLFLEQTKFGLFLDYDQLRMLLEQPSQLTTLTIIGDLVASWPQGGPRINLPHLRSFRYCANLGEGFSGLLLLLNSPSLESLFLKGVHPPDLDLFLNRARAETFPSLRSLMFFEFDLPYVQYGHLFRVFPSISDFTLINTDDCTPHILRIMIAGRRQPWQELQTLNFVMLFTHDEHMIREALEKRICAGCPIHCLGISMPEDEEMSGMLDYEWLRKHTVLKSLDTRSVFNMKY